MAILHVVLARGTYPEQYLLTGIFVWLMAWRMLDRYGQGADGRALAMLAVASCLFTALLEAGFLWARRGYELSETLGQQFHPRSWRWASRPAWQVLGFGLVVALAAAVLGLAAGRQTLRGKTAGLAARQTG